MNRPDNRLKNTITLTVKWLVFLAVLLIALNLRRHTFNLPHHRGDQHHYVALAFKLETEGIKGYNLRGVDRYLHKDYPNLIMLAPAKDEGNVLKSLFSMNVRYYDEPLHHVPFGFPLAIMASHMIFAHSQPYYILMIPNDTEIIMNSPDGSGLKNYRFDPAIAGKQFYAVVVPLFFSILLIVTVYFLTKLLYESEWVALTAMYLVAISPIDILTSQKVWADDMTAALSALALFLYMLSLKKNIPLLALAGGLSCGLSAISKQSGIFIAIVIILWHLMTNAGRLVKKEHFLKVVFDKYLFLFGLGIVLSAGYWFYKVFSVYGNPVYRPHQAGIAAEAKTEWFKTVGHRPRSVYAIGTVFQNPVFGLAFLSPVWSFLRKERVKETLLLLTWIAVFLCIFQIYLGKGGKELRYMLPSYPAFAILGAFVVDHIRRFLDVRIRYRTGTVLLVIILIASLYWSAPMGLKALFYNSALIMRPF